MHLAQKFNTLADSLSPDKGPRNRRIPVFQFQRKQALIHYSGMPLSGPEFSIGADLVPQLNESVAVILCPQLGGVASTALIIRFIRV